MPEWSLLLRELFPDVLKLGVGVALGWYAHVLNVRREGAKEKAAFMGFLDGQCSEMGVTDDSEFQDWFTRSKPKMARRYTEIRRHVKRGKRKDFDAACDRYEKAQKADIQDSHTDRPGFPFYQMGYETGRDLVRTTVKVMRDCVG